LQIQTDGTDMTVFQCPAEARVGKRIAVACHELICSGGLLRFERFGRVVRQWGHELCFVVFSPNPRRFFETQCEVMSVRDACKRSWDITMVPGAGFPPGTIKKMRMVQSPVFGIRVQHVLNAPVLAPRFLSVNRALNPHVVVFNNRHWTRHESSALKAVHCAVVEGAVEARRLVPFRKRHMAQSGETCIIGGLANKNPGPLLDAVRRLPARYVLRLFGDPHAAQTLGADLIAAGRLECPGFLDEAELPDYYGGIDCVVHTEPFAGWSNLAAEALACGVPLICTQHGTRAFAEHGTTALIVEPNCGAIAEALETLSANSGFAATLTRNGRARIEPFTWERYARQLLDVCDALSTVAL
jgi:glycosyltransferase involved in cell wall biosynthesis